MEKFWIVLGPQEVADRCYETENVAVAEARQFAQGDIHSRFYVLEAVAEVVGKVEAEVKKLS